MSEHWLDEMQTKLFEVVKENFGSAKVLSVIPEGTRTFEVCGKTSGVKKVVVLSSSVQIAAYPAVDLVITPTNTGPTKDEIRALVDAALKSGS